MSSSFYLGLREIAHNLLVQFGQDVTLTLNNRATYDPSIRTPTLTPVNKTIRAAIFNYEKKYVDGVNILATDQYAIASAKTGDVPRPSDTVTVGGVPLNVLSAEELSPAGTRVLWILQLRKGVDRTVSVGAA